MTSTFTEFHDLAPLGFPGWQASTILRRGADTKGGAAFEQAVRREGSQLDVYVEAGNAAELFARMGATIDLNESWVSEAARQKRAADHAEWLIEDAQNRVRRAIPE